MKMTAGALARTTSDLNLRSEPRVTDGNIVAVLVKDALAWAVADPAGLWVKVRANGWTVDGKTLYFEADTRSGVKATVRQPAALVYEGEPDPGGWRRASLVGYVSTGYLTVVDGPA